MQKIRINGALKNARKLLFFQHFHRLGIQNEKVLFIRFYHRIL